MLPGTNLDGLKDLKGCPISPPVNIEISALLPTEAQGPYSKADKSQPSLIISEDLMHRIATDALLPTEAQGPYSKASKRSSVRLGSVPEEESLLTSLDILGDINCLCPFRDGHPKVKHIISYPITTATAGDANHIATVKRLYSRRYLSRSEITPSYPESNLSLVVTLSYLERVVFGDVSTDDADPFVHMDIGCGRGMLEMQRIQLLRLTGNHVGIGIDKSDQEVATARRIRQDFSKRNPDFCGKV